MVFSSVQFLFYFLPLFFLCYYALPGKNLTLTLFSFVFYAWGEPAFVPILAVYILINWGFGLLIDRAGGWKRWALAGGVLGNFGLLVYFKYFNFLAEQARLVAGWLGWGFEAPPPVLLPLGISFITFQGVSYVVDVYRGTVPAQRSLLNFAMYKSMFPQLIAGPIVRYSHIKDDVERRPVVLDRLFEGARQFMVGFAQKVLIANTLAAPADQIFALPADELSMATAWLGIACYTLQIFFDFAGYSNMAIGLGHMIGFRFPINFDRPYAAQSITEFWRRWHMSLSSWFRDYLYIPLGGNRGSALRTYANLFTVFVLCGFWHGASWNFMIWGAYHGLFLVIERLGLGRLLESLWRPLRHAYLVLVVMVGWVFFRADDLPKALDYLNAMAGLGGPGSPLAIPGRYLFPSVQLALLAGVLLSTLPAARWLAEASRRLDGVPGRGVPVGLAHAGLFGLTVLAVLSIAGGAYNPFIYYRF
ncbi:MAG TPA: MBOAT family protein [Azospirillaceae bacterium]|nr:MBOAT family protein [Azospirillaceae bacterium]